jgi:hypothetical protein
MYAAESWERTLQKLNIFRLVLLNQVCVSKSLRSHISTHIPRTKLRILNLLYSDLILLMQSERNINFPQILLVLHRPACKRSPSVNLHPTSQLWLTQHSPFSCLLWTLGLWTDWPKVYPAPIHVFIPPIVPRFWVTLSPCLTELWSHHRKPR